jgi:hypothetical protein
MELKRAILPSVVWPVHLPTVTTALYAPQIHVMKKTIPVSTGTSLPTATTVSSAMALKHAILQAVVWPVHRPTVTTAIAAPQIHVMKKTIPVSTGTFPPSVMTGSSAMALKRAIL